MIGEKLRKARHDQNLSLEQVASRASISAATLSRVETNKQALDVALLMSLSNVLGQHPAVFFDADTDAGTSDVSGVVQQLNSLDNEGRTKVWNDLANASRARRATGRKSHVRQIGMQVEELLAQIDFLRAEIEAVKKRLN